ncbi:recombinase family protein [Micromonospora sp. NPDC007220]|uniref:recombinase family protein n=1 Tax=Micromonospora sp. NPDC007220 TaxID=3154318 RepID=UPI0033E34338
MTRRRAAKYRRISDDREGRELGITRQDEDLDALAERENLVYVADYVDNDISASTRSTKRRPEYEQMLADAEAGHFEVIAAYTTGRLTRRPMEHEAQIKLAEHHGIEFVYVKSPSFNLKDSAGRRVARILAANDAGEAEDISERVERDVRRRAEAGEFHGGTPPFGIDGDREIVKGKLRYVRFRHHTTDAPRVRDAVRRLLAGETAYGIAKELGMQRRTLLRALVNPAIAGLREYNGELFPTPWEPIVDRDDWQRVREILADPSRRKSETNQRKYMLSGLVYHECGYRMTSTSAKSTEGPTYECNPGRNPSGGCGRGRIVMRPLEAYIAEQVFVRLDSPALQQAMARDREGVNDTERELRKAVRDDEDALTRLGDERDDNLINEAEYRRRRARLTDRLEANRAALDKATRAQVHTRLPSGTQLRAIWAEQDQIIRDAENSKPKRTEVIRAANTWKRTILASVIERIEIGPQPINPETGRLFTSAPPRRRGEDEEAWRQRFELHRAKVFSERVTVTWLV